MSKSTCAASGRPATRQAAAITTAANTPLILMAKSVRRPLTGREYLPLGSDDGRMAGWKYGQNRLPEPSAGTFACFACFVLAVTRRRRRHQRSNQSSSGGRDLLDRFVEHLLVGA